METVARELLQKNERTATNFGGNTPDNLRIFFVYDVGNELAEKTVSSLQHMGEVTIAKLARSFKDINDFINEFEPQTITLEHQHLNAQGVETLLPEVLTKKVPVVFLLTQTNLAKGYLCIGMEFSCRKGDYYGRLFPTVKDVLQQAWQ